MVTQIQKQKEVQFSAKFQDHHMQVNIEGTVVGQDIKRMSRFLRNLLTVPVESWKLQFEHLDALSLRGIRIILKFVQALKRQGKHVEIIGASPMFVLLVNEMNLQHWFETAAMEL